ncbi:MAG: VCBS repeat-containing protein [Desulfomonile tiedjei]|nr:VCBS repeat-containing protein [Desulfomonile tiedjei]
MGVFDFWNKPKVCRPTMLLQQLEERIVLDAAITPTDQQNQDNTATNPTDQMDPLGAAGHADAGVQGGAADAADSASQLGHVFNKDLNVVLISNALGDIDAISNAVVPGAHVIVYDAHHDTIETITGELAELVNTSGEKIDHLAVLSHGESGHLSLSTIQSFNALTVELNPAPWTALGGLFDEGARIDFYACEMGSGDQGLHLLSAIAKAAGATVWASSDATGNLGGADWDLEVKTGPSEMGSLIDASGLTGMDIYLTSAPVVDSQNISVNEDGTLTITVTGSDADDPDVRLVTFEVTGPVDHGTLSVLGSVVKTSAGHYSQEFLYKPTSDYSGPDDFQFAMKTPADGGWRGFAAGVGPLIVAGFGDGIPVVLGIFTGDLNDDGHMDLVFTKGLFSQPAPNFAVYYNDGNGGFENPVFISSPNPTYMAFGDLNGDGDLDLVVANNLGPDVVYFNQGDGTLVEGTWLGGSEGPSNCVAVADLDNDNDLDIVVGRGVNGDLRSDIVYFNDSTGVFTPYTIPGSDTYPTFDLFQGNINGDEYVDLAFVDAWGWTAEGWMPNPGDGRFSGVNNFPRPPEFIDEECMVLDDFDNDGLADVLVPFIGPNQVLYLKNEGDGYGAWTTFGTLSFCRDVDSGDIDGDGYSDVVIAGDYGGLGNVYYLNDASGNFADGPVSTSTYSQAVHLADVNNDGYLDLLYGQSDGVHVHWNLGGETISSDVQSVQITIDPVNDEPVNTVPVSDPINRIHVTEDVQHLFGTDVVQVDDVDIARGEGDGTVQVTLNASNGALALTGSTTGLTGDTDGSDGTLSFSGLLANVNDALDGLAFTGNLNYNGDAQIVMETSDLGNNPAPALTDTDTVYLTVDAVNDAPTDITLGNSTIAENAGLNALVGTFTSTDPDAGDTFVYALVQGEEWFTISGNQLLANTSFDYETLPNDYSIRVQVTDQNGAGLSFESDFTITVTDVNEVPTDISLIGSTVAENLPADTVVGTLGATDQDTGQTFTYSLVSNPDGAFQIVGNELQTGKSLDHEATPTIDVTVRVTDSGTPGLSYDKVFTIAVADVNEAPTDIALTGTTVAENQPANTVVGTLGATDPDTGQTFTYSLVSNPDDAFKIVGNELQTAKPLDHEATPTIDVTVRVTDSGTPELTYDKVFTIAVSDANNAPVNTLGTFSVPAGTAQLTLSPYGIHVHDQDPNDFLSVRVQAGTGVTGVGWGPRPTFAPEYVYVGTETVLNPLLEGIAANIQPGFAGQATVLVTTTDLAGLSTTGTVIINVAPGQLPPQVTIGATGYEVYEDGNPVDLGTCVTVSDPNSDALTVNLVAPVGSGWSALNAIGSGGATVTGNGTTSLRIAGSMVDVQNTLLTLHGTLSTNFNGNSGINVTVSDGRNAPVNAALTIPVEAVNDAPVATAGIVVSGDVNSAIPVTLGMTDPLDAPFAGGPDALQSVTVGTGPAHGTVTHTGSGAGDWTYTPNLNWTGTDTFTYLVTDNGGTADGGVNASASAATVTVNVGSANDAPVNTVPLAIQNVTQGQSLIFTGTNGISVTDADAGTAAIQVDLTATHGTLTLGGRPSATLTITGNGSGTVHIVGTQADINTALNGLTYLPDSWYNGPATITMGTSDLGHTPPPAMTDSDVVNINIIRVR